MRARLDVVAWLTSLASLVSLSACSTGATATEGSEAERPAAAEPASSVEAPPDHARVLVTGFNDWRELGDPPNVWRCRDNPSCRLLVGAEATSEPRDYAGPLVARLQAAAPELDWRFATMPVTWGAFASVPDDVDVIVNIGLGVYDRFDALQLEVGAYNLSEGTDAAGVARSAPIEADAGEVLPAPSSTPIAAKIEALAGQTMAGYEVLAAEARPQNSYLCNETHYHALEAVHASTGRLREVYFLHIPYAKDGDYEALAEGVAGVVLGLVR